MKGSAAFAVVLVALAVPGALGFFATSLTCCEDKCSAMGLDVEATQACRMHGCMQRWNGESVSMCAARCMDRAGTVNKEACLRGCKGFDACSCKGGSYFSKPSAWADATAATSCASCPAGFACPGVQSQPTKCGAGSWAHASASACTECTAGRWGSGGSQTPQCSGPCAAGRFGRAGAQTTNCHGGCVVAPGRYARVAGNEVSCSAACPAGRYGAGDSQSNGCSGPCAAGTYAAGGAAKCSKCPAGTFGAVKGAMNQMCSGLCAAGKYSDAGATTCLSAGDYKPPTTTTRTDAVGGKVTEATVNHLGGTMNTIRGQTGMTSCDQGARRVCSTTTACELGGEPITCPLTSQFKGHYIRLITSKCACDGLPTTPKPVALVPKDHLVNGQCLNGNKVVADQWSGVGEGAEWCNHCMCATGRLICTTLSCGTTTAAPGNQGTPAPKATFGKECVNGGAIVKDGWMGPGTGAKWCTMCTCNAKLNVYTVCSQNVCKTEPATTPAPTKLNWETMCKRGTSFVQDGWTGKGSGSDWCNMCTCSKTRMSCTKMACGADPNVCMNGHEPVQYGWMGTGKGAQWCNQCRCTKESFICTPKVCGADPNAVEKPTVAPAVAGPKLDIHSCVNGGVKVADGWHGPAAGDAYCNVCTCTKGALACTKMACPPRERAECKPIVCPAVAPACIARATLPKPKRDYAGCCFDPSKDCSAAAMVSTYVGKYAAAAPFLNNGGEALVVKSDADCQEECLKSSACLVGTFITSGEHEGECWLSANTHREPLTCDKPCDSFAKRLGASHQLLPTKAPINAPNPPVTEAPLPAKQFGNACKCDVGTSPASALVKCHADLIGMGHIRVRHMSPRFSRWETLGNEGHVCRLVRGAKDAEGGGTICARRDMEGKCAEWENFACRCCDCTADGVPALLTMVPRANITMVDHNRPLLDVTKSKSLHSLRACMEECTANIACMAGEFDASAAGMVTCKLSAHVGSPRSCGGGLTGCSGFTKKTLRAGTDTIAVAKTANSTMEVASLGSSTVVRLDVTAGTYRAVEPYLTGGPAKVASLEVCQTMCSQEKKCVYGTYIKAGVNAGQCWLSEHGRTAKALLCASPCQSFAKHSLGAPKPALMP